MKRVKKRIVGLCVLVVAVIALVGCNRDEWVKVDANYDRPVTRVWNNNDVSFTLVKRQLISPEAGNAKLVKSVMQHELSQTEMNVLQQMTPYHGDVSCDQRGSRYFLSVQKSSGALQRFISSNAACEGGEKAMYVDAEKLQALFDI